VIGLWIKAASQGQETGPQLLALPESFLGGELIPLDPFVFGHRKVLVERCQSMDDIFVCRTKISTT
jgi:hypothetical protein